MRDPRVFVTLSCAVTCSTVAWPCTSDRSFTLQLWALLWCSEVHEWEACACQHSKVTLGVLRLGQEMQTQNSTNIPVPVLEKTFKAARLPFYEIHLVSGSFISEEPEQREDGVSYDFCKPACPTSTWQAHFLHTTICLSLFQVSFCLACLFSSSVFSSQWYLVPPL